MKEALTQSYDLFWRGADADPQAAQSRRLALNHWRPVAYALSARSIPRHTAQKDALAAAKANLALMEQTRLLQCPCNCRAPVAWSLVTSVILWSMFLFCGFGVLSGTNPTAAIVALAFGAISVASAMFLILDLTQPYFRPVSGSAVGDPSRRSTRSNK